MLAHILDDGLEGLEVGDLLGAADRDGLVGEGEVLAHDGVVVDDAVALDCVGDCHDVAVKREGHALVCQQVVEVGVLQRSDGGHVLGDADRSVDLEDRRGRALGQLAPQRLLVLVRGGRDDLEVVLRIGGLEGGLDHARIDVCDFRLEVQEVDFGLSGTLVAALREDAGYGEEGDEQNGQCLFHSFSFSFCRIARKNVDFSALE